MKAPSLWKSLALALATLTVSTWALGTLWLSTAADDTRVVAR